MELVIFRGNGQTGRLVTALALAAGHHVTLRDTPAAGVSGARLTLAAADARDARAVTPIVQDADAMVSVLGTRLVAHLAAR